MVVVVRVNARRDGERTAMKTLGKRVGLTTLGLSSLVLSSALACTSAPTSDAPTGGKERAGGAQGDADDAPAKAVLTQHNDRARTGAALDETTLKVSNVSEASFGKKASLPVHGSVTAQPLYLPDVQIGNARHNVVYLATMRNLVYAFDADSSSTTPLWQVSLGPSILLPDGAIGTKPYHDIAGEIGIISTPVISPKLNALFVVAASKDDDAGFHHVLHRLDLRTGRDTSSVEIQANDFTSSQQNQRSSLLLANGTVYVAFAAYGDAKPYRGFIFAYDAETLSLRSIFRTTQNNDLQGGIWMAGQGPAADSQGDVYAITGNGEFNPVPAPSELETVDLGNSFIKLSAGEQRLLSWFSPSNNTRLNGEDGDLGSSGPMLLPNTDLVLGAGKEGVVFLLKRDQLGYFTMNDQQPNVVQRFFANRDHCAEGEKKLYSSVCHHIHGSAVYWEVEREPWIYVWPENDSLKAFHFDSQQGRFDCRGATAPDCDPISHSDTMDPDGRPGGTDGMPGGFLSLSANADTAGTGIVWALHSYQGDANQAVVEGVLRAYDASDLSKELWNSRKNVDRDDVGPFAKSAAPTIANGRVYAPSFTGLSGKATLSEASDQSPALAAGPGSLLYLAWTERDGHLSLESATGPNGFKLARKNQLSQTSATGPALAGNESALYLGFVDSTNGIHVLRSSDQFKTSTEMNEAGADLPATLPEKSKLAPALATGNGRVFLAFTGVDGRLTLLSGASDGTTFDASSKVILAEESSSAPDLAYFNDRLYVAWTDSDTRLNVAYLTDGSGTLSPTETLSETSPDTARVLGLGAGAGAEVHLFWRGTNDALNVKTAENSELTSEKSGVSPFRYKLTFAEASSSSPASTVFHGQVILSWPRAGDGQLNVARYNPGEVGVYGLLEKGQSN